MRRDILQQLIAFRPLVALAAALVLAGGCGEDGNGPADAAVDALPAIEFTHADLVEACVRINACDIDRQPRLKDCVESFYKLHAYLGRRELFERMYHCANQGAGDCKIIRECLGFEGRPAKCDSSYTARCDGDVAWSCDLRPEGGWERAIDCGLGRLKCAVKDTGSTLAATCGGGPCDQSSYTPECVDKKLYQCVGGAIEVDDCVARQLQCRDPKVGLCEGTGRSCQEAVPVCKGDIMVTCTESYLTEIDCSKVYGDKTCDENLVQCVGTGKQCSEDSVFDSCEGDELVACVDGYVTRFDCKELGFLGCQLADTYGAYCKAEPVYGPAAE